MEKKLRSLERTLDLTKVDNDRFEATMEKHQRFISEAWIDLAVVLSDTIGNEKMAAALRRRIEEVSMAPRTAYADDLLAESLRAVELRAGRPGR